MTAEELYALLDKAGIDYEVIEIFEGSRFLRVPVDDETEQFETEVEQHWREVEEDNEDCFTEEKE